jgi:hypothetical protein
MTTDRHTILALIATGRITAAEAERLLVAWNEGRETAWILVFSVVVVCLGQLRGHPLSELTNFFNPQIPALAGALRHAFTDLMGGLL